MNPSDDQELESYVPVYDVVPEKWEDARVFLVEQLKRISNAVNVREIGFFTDEEVLAGKFFIPGVNIDTGDGNSQQFRTVLRIVVIVGPIAAGINTVAHGITNDANFTLIDLWASATNSTTLVSTIFGNSDTIRIIGNDIQITSDGAYDRCHAFIEYIQEL